MPCNCITEINTALSEKYPDAKLDTVTSFPEMKENLFQTFSYKVAGKKKRKTGPIFCNYCPFCGVRLR